MKLFSIIFMSIAKDACKNNTETSEVFGITGKNGWWRRKVHLDCVEHLYSTYASPTWVPTVKIPCFMNQWGNHRNKRMTVKKGQLTIFQINKGYVIILLHKSISKQHVMLSWLMKMIKTANKTTRSPKHLDETFTMNTGISRATPWRVMQPRVVLPVRTLPRGQNLKGYASWLLTDLITKDIVLVYPLVIQLPANYTEHTKELKKIVSNATYKRWLLIALNKNYSLNLHGRSGWMSTTLLSSVHEYTDVMQVYPTSKNIQGSATFRKLNTKLLRFRDGPDGFTLN